MSDGFAWSGKSAATFTPVGFDPLPERRTGRRIAPVRHPPINQVVRPVRERSSLPAEFRSELYRGVGHTYTTKIWTELPACFDGTLEPGK
jgi:hypothetical protein